MAMGAQSSVEERIVRVEMMHEKRVLFTPPAQFGRAVQVYRPRNLTKYCCSFEKTFDDEDS